MTNYLKNNPVIDAVIYLKNGTRKCGVLFDHSLRTNDLFHFISNTNLPLFQTTNNREFIEVLESNQIFAIDTDLK